MSQIRLWVVGLCLTLVFAPVAVACLWDYDTLSMERSLAPDIHELIVGKFPRHSAAYYQWRIEDREKKPVADRSPEDYNDIAVAYEKLHQHGKAIETILEKIARWPEENRYESEANLGTFLIHKGDFEAGLVHINNAIELNPDAHFGREIYQKRVVEYVLEVEGEDRMKLPQSKLRGDFAFFLLSDKAFYDIGEMGQNSEVDKAIKGISGMMQFGNYNSPILLESLASLTPKTRIGSSMLGARALLMASYQTEDAEAKAEYRSMAKRSLEMQLSHDLPRLEAELKSEIEQAETYFAGIEKDEKAWAAAGKNLDEEFAKKYYEIEPLSYQSDFTPLQIRIFNGLGFLALLLVVGLGLFYVRKRSLRNQLEFGK